MKLSIRNSENRRHGVGFSLVEALITVSLIAVLSAIVVSSYSNASTQSHEIIARQQAAAVKSALDSYINAQLSSVAGGGGGSFNNLRSISTVRNEYNALSFEDKWDAIGHYLDPESMIGRRSGGFDILGGDSITSTSLEKSGDILQFPTWTSGDDDYPLVDLKEDPTQ